MKQKTWGRTLSSPGGCMPGDSHRDPSYDPGMRCATAGEDRGRMEGVETTEVPKRTGQAMRRKRGIEIDADMGHAKGVESPGGYGSREAIESWSRETVREIEP